MVTQAIEQYQSILKALTPHQAKLVAVSKTKPISQIKELYQLGQRIFGENRVQEVVEKAPLLPDDINWHFIGHLQTKKVKSIAAIVDCIHSIDTPKLLLEINKQAAKHQRKIDGLLQFKIAEEDSKYGLTQTTAAELLSSTILDELSNVRIIGVMGMATFTDNQDQIRSEFQKLKHYFDWLKTNYFSNQASFKEISMGMSGDYPIALEEGSTMVRIGSLLFGARNYG